MSNQLSGIRSYSRGTWPSFCLFGLGSLVIIIIFGMLSCRTSAPTSPNDDLTLALDAVPGLLKADSASVSTIWATVLDSGAPVRDSTVVCFAASQGTITAEATTRDGLARATFVPGTGAGLAVIIAQVRAVRDTVLVTVY